MSTGDAEEELNSKSSISAQGVPEGEDGSFTKNSGFVMDLSCIDHSGDRVAMARASRKEEEQFARTACISTQLSQMFFQILMILDMVLFILPLIFLCVLCRYSR